MAKASIRKPREPEIELHPDAWDRFTDFVKRIAKAGPQHRSKKPNPGEPTSPHRAPRKQR